MPECVLAWWVPGQPSSAGSIFLLLPSISCKKKKIMHKIHIISELLQNMSAKLEQIHIFKISIRVELTVPSAVCTHPVTQWCLAHDSSSFSFELKFTFLIICQVFLRGNDFILIIREAVQLPVIIFFFNEKPIHLNPF